jgi:hypothetical protein
MINPFHSTDVRICGKGKHNKGNTWRQKGGKIDQVVDWRFLFLGSCRKSQIKYREMVYFSEI